MLSAFRKIFYFLSLFLLLVIVKELAEIYLIASELHPFAGYATLVLLLGFVIFFAVFPIVKILRLPKQDGPVLETEKKDELMRHRLAYFRLNPLVLEGGLTPEMLQDNEESYDKAIAVLKKKSEKIRKRYVVQLFYSSSISQNGFLDAILILSSSVNLIKDIFVVYNGRVSNKDLWEMGKRVYMSMAIGGSEGVEYATQEFLSKFATDSFKSVPFADKVLGSLADGFVNAALLTRISLITENYCTLLHVKSNREIYPSAQFIVKTTRFITSDVIDKMVLEFLRLSRDKTIDYLMLGINPVGHLLSLSLLKMKEGTDKFAAVPREVLKDLADLMYKPLGYGLQRVGSMFKRRPIIEEEIQTREER